MELANKKINKATFSLMRAVRNFELGNYRQAIGDLDFVKENAQEAIHLIIAELEDKNE